MAFESSVTFNLNRPLGFHPPHLTIYKVLSGLVNKHLNNPVLAGIDIMRYTQVASLFSLLLLACCGPSANPPGVPQSLEAQEGVTQLINYPGIKHVSKTGVPVAPEKRDDAANIVQQWLVGAPEIVTQAQINEASGFLHSLTNTVPKKVSRSDGLFLFWVANMTQAQADQASKHSGIASVELNQKVAEARVPRVQSSPPKPRQVVYFETQEMAVTELAAISQPRYAI